MTTRVSSRGGKGSDAQPPTACGRTRRCTPTLGASAPASVGHRRYHRSTRPPCRQPKAGERPTVLPPPTGSHAGAGLTGGASSWQLRASPLAGGTASRARRRRFAARGWLGGTFDVGAPPLGSGSVPPRGSASISSPSARASAVVGGRTHRCRPTPSVSVLGFGRGSAYPVLRSTAAPSAWGG